MKIGGCGGVGGGLLVMVVVMVCAFVNCEWVDCVVCDRGQSNLANWPPHHPQPWAWTQAKTLLPDEQDGEDDGEDD